MEKIINVSDLHKEYKKSVAVEKISFSLEPGEILGLLGPNGAGKTTTLRMITNLTPCDGGEVVIKGYPLAKFPHEAILCVGATLEIPSFYNELSGWENLLYSAGMYHGITVRHLRELIDLVGLSGSENKPVKHYSTGMRQRLGLARTLIANPELVILDEPVNGLDPQGMIELYDLIRHMAHEKHIAFIISSHQLHDMETICSEVLILNHGISIVQGKTRELLRGEKDTVVLTIRSMDKLLKIIASIPKLTVIRTGGMMAEIRLHHMSINELLTTLIQAEIVIEDFYVKQITLEDLFLKTVREQAI